MSKQNPGDLAAILLVEDNPTDAHLMKAVMGPKPFALLADVVAGVWSGDSEPPP